MIEALLLGAGCALVGFNLGRLHEVRKWAAHQEALRNGINECAKILQFPIR